MSWNGSEKIPNPQKSVEDFLHDLSNNPKGILYLIIVLVVVAALFTSFYTVQPYEQAVVLRLGKYLRTENPGLHVMIPFGIDRVQKVPTGLRHQESFGFNPDLSSSGGPAGFRGSSQLDDESLMLTGDLNMANVTWVVQYSISDPQQFLFNVRDPRKNIRDIAQAAMRRVVGDRTVNEVLTVGRVAIEEAAREYTQNILSDYKMGVKIDEVQLQDVNPPERVRPSFNEVNAAKQEQEQLINNAEAYRNKVIPEARGRAEEEISRAEGYAAAVLNRARGDASKFSQIVTEYAKAPRATKVRLYLELVEELFARMPALTIVDPSVKGVLPMFTGGGFEKFEVKKPVTGAKE